MIKSLILVALLLLPVNASAETLISGVYRKGSPNAAEPKVQKSKYLKTIIGGIGVSDDQVRYILNVDITKTFKRPMFIKVEFENPMGEPFVEQADIPAGQKSLQLIHGPVKGLKAKKEYWIKASLYEQNDRSKPVDVLIQKILSYADTTGEEIIYQTAQPKANKKARGR